MAFKDTRPGEQAPELVEHDEVHGDKFTHPAFAQIGVSRVSGSTSLYDSDFQHQHYMTVRISKSDLMRNLGRDWHFARSEMIEVAMSESQWATFVSSPNDGRGVPCTLQHLAGERMPSIPMTDREPQFYNEMKETLAASIKHLDGLKDGIMALGLSAKKTDALLSSLRMARMQLDSNAPFVEEQFGTHMEKTVETAKAEIHGYMTATIQRAGLEAITGGKLPLLIETDK